MGRSYQKKIRVEDQQRRELRALAHPEYRVTPIPHDIRSSDADSGSEITNDDSWGRSREMEESDREDRRAWGYRFKSAYSTIVGPNPDCEPGDCRTAREKVHLIEKALDQGGWTRNEHRRLRRMLSKWKMRADGRDPRYNVVGNRKTGLTREQRDDIALRRAIRLMKEDITSGD